MGFELLVGHINHGLRPSADAEELHVREIADNYGLDFFAQKVKVRSEGKGLEDAARNARYRALNRMMEGCGADKIATGHTATDQAETMIYRLSRGTGVRGLTGIQIQSDALIRPLLGINANEIRAYMQDLGMAFVQDESNMDARFDRNFIRHEIMTRLEARFPGAAQRMAAVANDMAALRQFVEERSNVLLQQAIFLHDDARLVLDMRALQALDEYWLQEVFATIGRMIYGPARPMSRQHIDALVGLVHKDRPSAQSLPDNYTAGSTNGMLIIGHEISQSFDPTDLQIGKCPAGALYFDCIMDDKPVMPSDLWSAVFPATLKGRLKVRPVHNGDRIKPLGMKGTKKVFRAIMDAKIPRIYRSSWPVVVLDDDVLWVPGVARAGAELYEYGKALLIHGRMLDPVLKFSFGLL